MYTGIAMNAKTFRLKEFFYFAVPVMTVDIIIHIILYRWVASVFHYWDPADLVMAKKKILYFLIVSYFITVAIIPVRFYDRKTSVETLLFRAFLQTFLTLSLFAISIFVLFGNFAGKLLLQDGIITTIAISLWHLISRAAIIKSRKFGRNRLHTVIVGAGPNALRLYDTLQNGTYFTDNKILGFFARESEFVPEGAPRLGDIDAIEGYLNSNKVHVVYCSLNPAIRQEEVNRIIRLCEDNFIDFFYVPNMDGYLHRTMTYSEIGHVLVFQLRDEPLSNPVNAAFKRISDILISLLFLCTLYPIIWIFVAIGTKLSSPGPILFRQQRTGYKGKPFTMLKFRSMKVNADADKVQATEDDPRKTKFGDFLRRTSIDELPQFINVLKGDMSIIGPRPHMELHTETYNKLVDEYMVRHMAKPGLTGWAQVNGCRGETKELSQMADRVKHDIWYVENWSFFLDVKIFFMTVIQIFKGDSQAY